MNDLILIESASARNKKLANISQDQVSPQADRPSGVPRHVGQSENTRLKQENFRSVIETLLTIAIGASRRNSWTAKNYVEVIDCNAGTGKYKDKLDGSQLIGSPILLKERLDTSVAKKTVQYSLALIEKDSKQAQELKANLPQQGQLSFFGITKPTKAEVFIGNNNQLLTGEVKSWLLTRRRELNISPNLEPIGLIYSDPNGLIDCPWESLAKMSKDKAFKRHDILIYVNAVAIKRTNCSKIATGTDPDSLLNLGDYFDAIDKNHWLISELKGDWQQFFLLGMNTALVSESNLFASIGFIPLYDKGKGFDANGSNRFQQANYTQKELKQQNQEF